VNAILSDHPSTPAAPKAQVEDAPPVLPKTNEIVATVLPNTEPIAPAPSEADLADLKFAVTRLKISGIIGGVTTRAIVNGEVLRVGDIVDRQRGISIFQIEPEKRIVVFADREGRTVSRGME